MICLHYISKKVNPPVLGGALIINLFPSRFPQSGILGRLGVSLSWTREADKLNNWTWEPNKSHTLGLEGGQFQAHATRAPQFTLLLPQQTHQQKSSGQYIPSKEVTLRMPFLPPAKAAEELLLQSRWVGWATWQIGRGNWSSNKYKSRKEGEGKGNNEGAWY